MVGPYVFELQTREYPCEHTNAVRCTAPTRLIELSEEEVAELNWWFRDTVQDGLAAGEGVERMIIFGKDDRRFGVALCTAHIHPLAYSVYRLNNMSRQVTSR